MTEKNHVEENEFAKPTAEELSGVPENDAVEGEYVLPFTVDLDKPVVLTKNKTVTQIVFRNEIDGMMQEHLPVDTGGGVKLKLGHFYPLIAGMTGETVSTVRKMNRHDIAKCIPVVSYFL